MAGTVVGGLSAAKTNKIRYGADFYKQIGSIGGKRGRTGGFACADVGPDGLTGRQRAATVGQRGGRISRRTNNHSS